MEAGCRPRPCCRRHRHPQYPCPLEAQLEEVVARQEAGSSSAPTPSAESYPAPLSSISAAIGSASAQQSAPPSTSMGNPSP